MTLIQAVLSEATKLSQFWFKQDPSISDWADAGEIGNDEVVS